MSRPYRAVQVATDAGELWLVSFMGRDYAPNMRHTDRGQAKRRAAALNKTYAGQTELCVAYTAHLDKQMRGKA